MTASPTPDPGQDPIQIYQHTVRSLYAFVARRSGGDQALAEDVTQETYLRFVTECRTRIPEPAMPWLQTVARNLLLNHFRKRRPSSVDPKLLAEALDERAAEPFPATAALAWGMAQLSPLSARLLDDFHLAGKSVSTIAAQNGMSERAVEGRLRRGRAALRKILEPLFSKETHS